MITTRKDYIAYLEADRKALGETKSISRILFSDVWAFQRQLRRLEYVTNCRKPSILRIIHRIRFQQLARRCGFSIPINTFGPGLSIAHRGTIVVNGGARIGSNCRIHVCVNIGTEAGKRSAAPSIGDNCYIGPGAKLFGAITIGNDMAIGANAVVNKSFAEEGVTIAGAPARIISDTSSQGLLIKGFNEHA